jgi:uncharacterized membrane protein YqjE
MDAGTNPDAQDRGLRGSATRLSAALLGLVRSRLELASIEFAEERERIQQQLTLLVAAVGMLLFAVLFVATWIIVYFWDTNRLTAIAVVAIFFAAAGAVLLMLRAQAARSAPTPFAATVAEFDSDRKALAAAHDGARPAPPPL